MKEIRSETTPYGFNFGAAEVERLHRDEKLGCVWIGVDTKTMHLEILVLKGGKIRTSKTNKKKVKK